MPIPKGPKGFNWAASAVPATRFCSATAYPRQGHYLQQELAIITGACDAMVVDVQCVFQNLANVAKCFHTKLITTHPIARMEQDNVIHIEFDEHHALEDAKRIVSMAIDNFPEPRAPIVMIPKHKATQIAGFGVESIEYHLGGTFRGSYYTLNDNIINGRIRGVAGVVGCNNARTKHNEEHITIVKELIKNDVLVLTTGCSGITAGDARTSHAGNGSGLLWTGSGRGVRDGGDSAGAAHGILCGQQPHSAGGHRSGQGRRSWQ